jgi:protein involved in ribonucleotide reduction
LNQWSSQGVYSTDPVIVTTAHFDNGNENLDVDITSYINGIILSGNTNHGLGIAFEVIYQNITPEIDQSVAFFTKYTQTFFEPFVESVFQDRIEDNRHNFIEKQTQNLYLHVTKGTNYYDLDSLPTVDITDNSGTPISGLTGLTTNKIRKGIYKVTFGLQGVLCDGKRFYIDKWKGLLLNGVSISNVSQKFVPKPYTAGFTIGENQTELQRYVIQFFGLKQNEKILRGEKRKVVVTFRSINEPKSVLFDEVFYRIFIKEGRTDVVVYDWTQLDVTNENSFVFDTSFMIPREYMVEIKGKTHTEEIFYNETIKFEIVSEK